MKEYNVKSSLEENDSSNCITQFNNNINNINPDKYNINTNILIGQGKQSKVYCVNNCDKVAKVLLLQGQTEERFSNECNIYDFLKQNDFDYLIKNYGFWKCNVDNTFKIIWIMDKYDFDYSSKKYEKNELSKIYEIIKKLHEKGVIHGDIKPQNVMIKKRKLRRDKFALIDFGVSSKLTKYKEKHKKAYKAYDLFMFFFTFSYIAKNQFNEELIKNIIIDIKNLTDSIEVIDIIYTNINNNHINELECSKNNRLNRYLNQVFGDISHILDDNERCQDLFNRSININDGFTIGDTPIAGDTPNSRIRIYDVCKNDECKYIAKKYNIKDNNSRKEVLNEIKIYDKLYNKEYIPNIIHVFKCEWKTYDKKPIIYLIMDKYDLDLHEYLRNHTSLENEQVLNKVLEYLDDLHEEGYSHNDFKPNNIMVSNDGKPVIIDFGISKKIEDLPKEDKLYSTLFDYMYLLSCINNPKVWKTDYQNIETANKTIRNSIIQKQGYTNINEKTIKRIFEELKIRKVPIDNNIIKKNIINSLKNKKLEFGKVSIKAIDID